MTTLTPSGRAADVVRLVEHFLCDESTAEFGPYATPEGGTPVADELVPGRLYRLHMVDRDERTVDVQVFLGLGDIGGLMWEQDVRALLRLSGSRHGALPEVADGGYRESAATRQAGVDVGGMAFVATNGSNWTAASVAAREWLAADPGEAVRQLRSLVDGLATLHGLGLAHRAVSPAAIDYRDGQPLRLARFELSALLHDIFRETLDSAAGPNGLQQMIRQDPVALRYAPQERVEFALATDAGSGLVEDDTSDVYGLGAVAWEWFVGLFPAERLPAAPTDDLDPEGASALLREHAQFRQYLRRAIVEAPGVPPDLAAIIARMLADEPDDRPSADEVSAMLTGSYDRIMSTWEESTSRRPHALVYMPKESSDTIFRWGLVDQDPATPEGSRELAEFISTDLRGAVMIHAEDGADAFVRGGESAGKKAATQLLRGQQVIWFCDFYQPWSEETGRRLPAVDHALVIKYVANQAQPWVERRLREMDWSSGRPVPELDVLSADIDNRVLRHKLEDRPTWRKLTASLAPSDVRPAWQPGYQRAIDWLLDYQDVELKARTYPYVRMEGSAGEVVVRYDDVRDLSFVTSSALFVKFAASPDLRPAFGDFFGRLENEDGGNAVDVLEDRNGRPSRRTFADAEFVRKDGPDRVVLRLGRGAAIPETGWIRSGDDRGSHVGLDRQREAAHELFRSRALLGQLHRPRTIRTFANRWTGYGNDLRGNGRAAMEEILVCEPFAAIQGPPGTGKTRVTATAVAAYLTEYPTARVLVSAQSNFALDNLAARVLGELGATDDDGRPTGSDHVHLAPIPLRVTSKAVGSIDRVDPQIRPWTRYELAQRQQGRIRQHVEVLLGDPAVPLPDGVPAVLREWSAALGPEGESILPELTDRLHRGANLVFATCAASVPELLSPAADAVYDWVVVEEAAKAWPTELAIPLVRGLRWTLVGDHFQLPAHRRHDIERFLDSCVADPHEGMALLGSERGEYLKAFDLFNSLFETSAAQRSANPPPLTRLSTQFRMVEPIGELVSRVFYPLEPQPDPAPTDGLKAGGLEPYYKGPRAALIPPVEIRSPHELEGASLVWLDTAGIASCRNEPRWSNPGEAAIVLELLQRLQPFPRQGVAGNGDSPLAVLTPYRAQVQLLKGSSLVRDHLSTIHAFQGREADMVVVSLVRDSLRAGREGPRAPVHAELGHLAQRELVNVMFSRARRLLVIIGQFDHYAEVTGNDGIWTQVCRAVRLNGQVLSAREIFGDLPPLVPRSEAADVDLDAGASSW